MQKRKHKLNITDNKYFISLQLEPLQMYKILIYKLHHEKTCVPCLPQMNLKLIVSDKMTKIYKIL